MDRATAVRLAADGISFDEIAVPPPGWGEVVVAIKAVSLNYRDLIVAARKYGAPDGRVIASDGAGEVVAVGPGVTRVAPGDRVAGSFFAGWFDGEYRREYGKSSLGGAYVDGALTTARIFDQRALVKIPGHLSFEEAAALPCAALTAWHALISVKPGDTVLILGTGGVAVFALQFAKLRGARLIITSSSDEKLAKARRLGADETINYRTTPEWEKEVLRLTEERGVDNVLELGGSDTFPRSLRSVRAAGQVSVIGLVTGTQIPIDVSAILPNIRVQGIYVGSVAMFDEMNRAIALHRLRPVIDRTFAFDEAREALRYLEAAQHFGKVVVKV